MRGVRTLLTVVLVGTLATGCASQKSFVTSKDFPETGRAIRKIGVVVAEARVIDIAAGGDMALNVEKTARCLSYLETSAVRSLSERGFEATLLAYDDEIRALLVDYLPFHQSIVGAYRVNAPIDSVGTLAAAKRVAAARGVAALAFFSLQDRVASGSRIALTGALALFGVGVATGGGSEADLLVLDATGRPVYYDDHPGGNFDLSSDAAIVAVCGGLTGHVAAR